MEGQNESVKVFSNKYKVTECSADINKVDLLSHNSVVTDSIDEKVKNKEKHNDLQKDQCVQCVETEYTDKDDLVKSKQVKSKYDFSELSIRNKGSYDVSVDLISDDVCEGAGLYTKDESCVYSKYVDRCVMVTNLFDESKLNNCKVYFGDSNFKENDNIVFQLWSDCSFKVSDCKRQSIVVMARIADKDCKQYKKQTLSKKITLDKFMSVQENYYLLSNENRDMEKNTIRYCNTSENKFIPIGNNCIMPVLTKIPEDEKDFNYVNIWKFSIMHRLNIRPKKRSDTGILEFCYYGSDKRRSKIEDCFEDFVVEDCEKEIQASEINRDSLDSGIAELES